MHYVKYIKEKYMTELVQYRCSNCGGDLKAISEEMLQCTYCSSTFENYSLRRKIDIIQKFLDHTKIEYINNQRRNLYDAICAKYISKNDVHLYATEIKKYLPDDFQATFCLEALSGDVKKINELIRGINVEENYEMLQPIIYFLVTSLQSEFLLELNLLVERAYKRRDPVLYSKYATKISEEAEKVADGVYETYLERDVFIAYSSKDMDAVSKLCETLEEQGFSCFVAARNLRHGVGSVENYDEALKDAMDNCTCFLFVSSVNSRKFDCDAVRKEIPHIKEGDKRNAPPEFYNYYEKIPPKYKKPRIEYRLDTMKSAADRLTAHFFDGYEWVYDIDGVIERLVQILTETPEDFFADESTSSGNVSSGAHTPAHAHAPAQAPERVHIPTSIPAPIPVPVPAPVQQKVCNHVEVIDPAVEPTCTEPGRTEGSHCKLCGEILRQAVTIQPRGHEFGAWKITKQASCTEEGKQERSCHCGEKETETIPSLGGHQPGDWETVKEATEKEKGLKVKKCTVCEAQVAREVIPKKQPPKAPAPSRTQKQKKQSRTAKQAETPAATVTAAPAPVAVNAEASAMPVTTAPAAPAPVAVKTSNSFSKNAPSRHPTAKPSALKKMNLKPSQGLEYNFNDDGKTCTVMGQGACIDNIICIPETANGYTVTAIGTDNKNSNGEFFTNFSRSIKGVVIPDSVTKIDECAFKGCTSLEDVVIPDSVTVIGDFAFCGCVKLFCMEIPKTVKSIGESAFNGCASLESAVIPKNITCINDGVFWNCSNLKSIELPDSILTIGKNAFSGCASLESMSVPDSVVSIGQSAFYGCKLLQNVTLPDSVLSIGWGMFNGCTNLKTVTIPDTVKSIESYAFYGCEKLESLVIPKGVTEIGSFLCDGCENLTSMAIPNKVKSIGEGAFRNCMNLAHVEIPKSVSSIGKRAFAGCRSLENLTFEGTKREWKRISTVADWKENSAISEVVCNNGNAKA